MKKILLPLITACYLLISGCVTTYNPTDPALKDIEKKDWVSAYSRIKVALVNKYIHGIDDKYNLLKLVDQYPEIISVGMVEFYNDRFTNLKNHCVDYDINRATNDLRFFKKIDFTPGQDMQAKLLNAMRSCVDKNNIGLDSLYYNTYPDVYPEDILSKAFANHLVKAVKDPKVDLDSHIVAYIKNRGANSRESILFYETLNQIDWMKALGHIQEKIRELSPEKFYQLSIKYYIADDNPFIDSESLLLFIKETGEVCRNQNAEVVRKSISESSFKNKKYLKMGIVDGNTYNLINLNKYQIGGRLFDNIIRKIAGKELLLKGIRKDLYGCNIDIVSSASNFLHKAETFETLTYQFFIPKEKAAEYSRKDITGQDLIDASVVLLNDERVEIKLQ